MPGLVFVYLVIAVIFIGPVRDPVRTIWITQFVFASIMVLPLAFIEGAIREMHIYWRLIDCSFGIIGIIPLYACYLMIKKLEALSGEKSA